tara:strand:+ start:10532 stop:10954 length:423 start_codon:yes stop_codon:yes gene_type:complete
MTDLVIRSKIDALEDAMNTRSDVVGASAFELKHHFTDNGMYAREIILPAGSIVVGKIKKEEHISVLSAGFVTELTEEGVQHIKAPYTMVSKSGTKRVVVAHETTVWTTIHFSEETNIDKMVDDIAVDTREQYENLLEKMI